MEMEQLRMKLLEERQRYREQVQRIDETGFGRVEIAWLLQEDAHADNHPGDQGTETFERGKDLGLRNAMERRLREIDIAIERMTAGTYLNCTQCGGPIGMARLEAFPSATRCIVCQEQREAMPDRFHRPVEEQVLSPPFGRTWRDDTGDPSYDGEDAWQETAIHGTSEMPSDVADSNDQGNPQRYNDLYFSEEDVYGIVDPMDALVDENYDAIGESDRFFEPDGSVWPTIYGQDDMEGEYHWHPESEMRTKFPEKQFGGKWSRESMSTPAEAHTPHKNSGMPAGDTI